MPYFLAIAAMVIGFGFVVFWHELGHFLAAKWVGIKVEQFAVGFGQALLAWRKGLGVRVGTTRHEYDRVVNEYVQSRHKAGSEPKEHLEHTSEEFVKAAEELGLSETEYRLNWIPLGGYVKMLGQDDMDPNAKSSDPRAFNRKSIGSRMIVVSAGVVMNVILAAILFTAVFLMGLNSHPAIVGDLQTNSPAQEAGIEVGDKFVTFDGDAIYDFNGLTLAIALARPNETLPVKVIHDGKEVVRYLRPRIADVGHGDMLAIGVGETRNLAPPDGAVLKDANVAADYKKFSPSLFVLPGEKILSINGQAINETENVSQFHVLDRVVQSYTNASPLNLVIRDASGKERTIKPEVGFEQFFGKSPYQFAGLRPRVTIKKVTDESVVKGKLHAGDVVISLRSGSATIRNLTAESFLKEILSFGDKEKKVDFVVERDGVMKEIDGDVPSVRTAPGKRGLGVQIGLDDQNVVVGDVLPDSAAAMAGIRPGTQILAVNNKPVNNWLELHQSMKNSGAEAELSVVDRTFASGQLTHTTLPTSVRIKLSPADQTQLANVRYATNVVQTLTQRVEVRKTSNPITACKWGVVETKNQILQLYVTLNRLVFRSVPASNLMGPLGIFKAGSYFAERGTDWLLWFLAMISANLAVVNFLPIPIVDGGLFLFLIIEKVRGRPLSHKAQLAAQYVGLAIILSLFVFVTYNDIYRQWL